MLYILHLATCKNMSFKIFENCLKIFFSGKWKKCRKINLHLEGVWAMNCFQVKKSRDLYLNSTWTIVHIWWLLYFFNVDWVDFNCFRSDSDWPDFSKETLEYFFFRWKTIYLNVNTYIYYEFTLLLKS